MDATDGSESCPQDLPELCLFMSILLDMPVLAHSYIGCQPYPMTTEIYFSKGEADDRVQLSRPVDIEAFRSSRDDHIPRSAKCCSRHGC